jgi:pyrroloquinoline quinone biosynthesis protein D
MTPRLVRHASVRWHHTRGEWLMHLPEQVVVLNETAAAVLALCDGQRSAADIVDGLDESYEGVEPADVEELLRDLAGQQLVELS